LRHVSRSDGTQLSCGWRAVSRTLGAMAKRQMTVRIDAELVAEVRRVIGPLGLMTETVTEAL
jgi:hypothetical protein